MLALKCILSGGLSLTGIDSTQCNAWNEPLTESQCILSCLRRDGYIGTTSAVCSRDGYPFLIINTCVQGSRGRASLFCFVLSSANVILKEGNTKLECLCDVQSVGFALWLGLEMIRAHYAASVETLRGGPVAGIMGSSAGTARKNASVFFCVFS